jgi:Tol biopolymer transport system component
MTLSRGARLGSYEVLSLIGVGGMGEVYLARDPKLNRDVALKILPDAFALDADRCARFEREAQILASLSHPAIGAIYGLEDGRDDSANRAMRALVLEHIEGPTLADELARGALPAAQALEIARQIADALEAAHERGIVHRDLKPANVKVRPDGLVKVLDFGLAKALEQRTDNVNEPSQPRTLLSPGHTEIGMLFGTPAYMSPEQVRGRPADKRSDVWAFGCVLYEMLTGQRAFPGDETSDVMAAILRAEPEWSALPSDLPSSVRRLLRRCLEKDRSRRLRDIGDARLELDDARLTADQAPAVAPSRSRERIAWLGAAALMAVLAAVGAARWAVDRVPQPAELRLDVTTGETLNAGSFALSPDGRMIVFNVQGSRGSQLWLRSLDDSTPRPLAGTEDGQFPFWSPDGRSIGFFTFSALKRVDVDGGPPQTLATVLTPAGGTWGADGTILYVPQDNGGVFRVSEGGGESTRVTPVRTPPLASRAPQFLPDGRHFLFHVGVEGESNVYIGDLESGEIRQLFGSVTPAIYGSGHLWFVNENTLYARPFDPATGVLTGTALRVAEDVSVEAYGGISASTAGAIAYRSGTRYLRRQLAWFDRGGRELGTVGVGANLRSNNPSLSPDGRQVLLQQTTRLNVDVWLLDLERSVTTRLTDSPAVESMPVWAPDGVRFVYNAPAEDRRVLAIKHVDGSKPDQQLATFDADDITLSTDWSPDGAFVVVRKRDGVTGTWDLWALPTDGNATPLQLTATPYDEREGQVSPDGRWLAYESNESGTFEIYVQPFPGPGAKVRVSTNGGQQVRWRSDGAELFYVALDRMLMALPVGPETERSRFGAPVPLFPTRLVQSIAVARQQYIVSKDGQRFLMTTAEEAPSPPITILLNWRPTSPR